MKFNGWVDPLTGKPTPEVFVSIELDALPGKKKKVDQNLRDRLHSYYHLHLKPIVFIL